MKNILNKIKVTPLKIIKLPTGNIMRILKKKNYQTGLFMKLIFQKLNSIKLKHGDFIRK